MIWINIICLGIPYTHIASPMPDVYRTLSMIPRGVANRRAAINWIRTNAKRPGVLYFGDDDNTFDLKLFDEIRNTKRVSMFPVGLIGLYAISTPIVKEVSLLLFISFRWSLFLYFIWLHWVFLFPYSNYFTWIFKSISYNNRDVNLTNLPGGRFRLSL